MKRAISNPAFRSLAVLGIATTVGLTGWAAAQMPQDVRIDLRGGGRKMAIHCEAFNPAGDRTARTTSVLGDEVLAKDLEWSGAFTVTRGWTRAAPEDAQAVVGGTWTLQGATLRLRGEVRDFPARRAILVKEYRGPKDQWRSLVHQFADDIVLQFTGEAGISQTKIAFVAPKGKTKELYVIDHDGQNLRALTQDQSIALSPGWSPDGSLLLFTSYKGGKGPQVFVTSSGGGRSYLVSGRPGLNTSASYSPDGREIVCTLSQDGNSEIYVLDARGTTPRRLTNARGIDTSPTWSPTGREIAFTSDRAGAPQVHVMDRDGGSTRRLTFDVGYTDSPAWSPKGDRVAFVARTGGGFDIYTCRPDGSEARLEVSGGSNENPRWSPDGRHLVFSSNRGGAPGLYVSDLDGSEPRKLETGGLAALSPAWSPRFGSNNAALRSSASSPSTQGGAP